MARRPHERRATPGWRVHASPFARPGARLVALTLVVVAVLALALPAALTSSGVLALGALWPYLGVLGIALVWQRLHLAREQRRRWRAELEARTDALTGLLNRRGLDERLHAALRGTPKGVPLGVILFDLDHFKRVNDSCGHETGDAVLAGAARELRTVLRQTDVFGRWGGEEFLVVLPGVSARAAHTVAERLRVHLRTHVLAGERAVTASFGVATWRPEDSLGTLLARADARMYAAKRSGRDRTVSACSPSELSSSPGAASLAGAAADPPSVVREIRRGPDSN